MQSFYRQDHMQCAIGSPARRKGREPSDMDPRGIYSHVLSTGYDISITNILAYPNAKPLEKWYDAVGAMQTCFRFLSSAAY